MKGKVIPVQAWTVPEVSNILWILNFRTVSTCTCQGSQRYATATFTPQEVLLVLIPVRAYFNTRVVVRPE